MNEDIIYLVQEFVTQKEREAAAKDPPEQPPLSRWAIEEIIYELKTNYDSYPDDILRRYMRLMDIYEGAAEIERKMLFRTAKTTINELFYFLFERCV